MAITGYGQEGQEAEYRECGFEKVLTKPVDPELLQSLLHNPPEAERGDNAVE